MNNNRRSLIVQLLINLLYVIAASFFAALFGVLTQVIYGMIQGYDFFEALKMCQDSLVMLIFAPWILLAFLSKTLDKTVFRVTKKGFINGLKILGYLLVPALVLVTLVSRGAVSLGGGTFSATIPPFLYYTVLLFCAAFLEEIIVRYLILGEFIKRGKYFWGLFVSSIIWSLLHGGNSGASIIPMINIFMIGMILGMMYTVSRNITGVQTYHFLWNWLIGPILGIEVSGIVFNNTIFRIRFGDGVSHLITGGKFGIEGSLILTAALVITGILYYQKKFKGYLENTHEDTKDKVIRG